MRTLLVVRHAKSSWRDTSVADHDRPLNGRGRRAAARMGRYLEEEELLPDLVLCSTARRTIETFERLCRTWRRRPEVRLDQRLYLAGADGLLAIVGEQEARIRRLMIVGHNPGLAELSTHLAARGEAELLDRLRRKLPTGAVVEIELDVESWGDVASTAGHLRRFVVPRELGD